MFAQIRSFCAWGGQRRHPTRAIRHWALTGTMVHTTMLRFDPAGRLFLVCRWFLTALVALSALEASDLTACSLRAHAFCVHTVVAVIWWDAAARGWS